LRYLIGGQARLRRRLKVRVLERRSPPVPEGAARQGEGRRGGSAAGVGHAGEIASHLAARQELGDGTSLGAAQRESLVAHGPAGQDVDDGLGGSVVQGVWGRSS